jgi:N6-adenosine-specific RNA methylase IME4
MGNIGNVPKAVKKAAVSSTIVYDNACRALAEALAEARSVSEAKNIHDQAAGITEWARRAKNHQVEADAAELRMKAQRVLGRMIEVQKQTVGLNRGTAGSGRPSLGGSAEDPPKDIRPTLFSQGIDKHLAHQARVLNALSEEQFKQRVTEARASAGRVVRRVVNEATTEQKRRRYRERTYRGGTVADLHALAATGFRAGVICVDAPWEFHTWSDKGGSRSPKRHYDTMTLDDIKALPVPQLAAKDCAALLWAVCPELPGAIDVIRAWGFEYSTVAFAWVKQNPSGDGLFTGLGYHTRSNIEPCLLALRGAPVRLAMDVHQVVMAPVGAHSEKPDEVYRRIERLYPGPYLELFARRERPGWSVWGNEVPPLIPASTKAAE